MTVKSLHVSLICFNIPVIVIVCFVEMSERSIRLDADVPVIARSVYSI